MHTTFSTSQKKKLRPNQELNRNGLIWRRSKKSKCLDGTYRYDFTVKGQRYQGVIGKDSEGITTAFAQKYLDDIRAKITLGLISPDTGRQKVTFAEIAKSYLEFAKEVKPRSARDAISRTNKHLLPYFGEKNIVQISKSDLEDFQALKREQCYSNQTINHFQSLLSNIFERAISLGVLKESPVKLLKRLPTQAKERRIFTFDEIEELIKAARQIDLMHECLVLLGWRAGLRRSEVLGLDKKQLNFEKGTILVDRSFVNGEVQLTTKSGKVRYVPMKEDLKIALQSYVESLSDNRSLIFSTRYGKPIYGMKRFDNIKEVANFDCDRTFHCLRHSYITHLIKSKVDLPTVKKLAGHSDISTTMSYTHIDDEHIQQAILNVP